MALFKYSVTLFKYAGTSQSRGFGFGMLAPGIPSPSNEENMIHWFPGRVPRAVLSGYIHDSHLLGTGAQEDV